MRHSCLLLLVALLLPLPGQAQPDQLLPDPAACTRVAVAPGPHSLQPLPDSPRLLISSHDRRGFAAPGGLYEYDRQSGRVRELPRDGEPAGLVLRPQHMDLARQGGELRLYVINHDEPTPHGRRHSILVYAVTPERLLFRERLSDPLLSSPNHLSVAPDGDLYVSNGRRDGSSVMELVLRRKKATLVHYRRSQGWRVAAEGLGFPNGVRAEAERVYAVLNFGNAMLSWPRHDDGHLGPPLGVVSLPKLNGLNPGPRPNTWLTVSHGSLLDVLLHRRSSDHAAPGTVFLVDADTKRFTPFFSDDGRRISAMSNAVLLEEALYIGQSFDGFILRCPLPGRGDTAGAQAGASAARG